ncbi:MAG: diacylglycerol O-acyltransferase [Halieaceae bacterium]|jgi:diacylglycerol O-acyltransferase
MPRIVKNIPMMDLMAYLIESVDSPTHVGILQIFKPGNASSTETVQRVLAEYRTCEVAPPFNYYPVFPRFGMPKWAEAEAFEVDYHIRHIAVPPPGTDRQLIDVVMDLHASMMDRSRPGWIAYVIEGLENNCFAVYWKVHHAYIDGASAVMRLDAAMSKTPGDMAIRPMWGPLFAPAPSAVELTLSELMHKTSKGLGLQARAMSDIGRTIGKSIKQARGLSERKAPLPFSAPHSLFNKPVHATRKLGVGAIPLARFKAIAKHEAVSINEVALTLVGVALDRYNKKYGEQQEKQLLAACPMAVRSEGDNSASTQIASIAVKLGYSGMAIHKRLRLVHESSNDAKEDAKEMSKEALMNYMVLLGGAATIFSKTRLGDYIPPLTSVNVSNVAGPNCRYYHGGAELVRSYPLSTLAGGTAINITFASLNGRMDFAVISDAKAIPGAQEIADFILEAVAELEAVTVGASNQLTKQKATAAKKRSAPAVRS